MKKRVLLSCIAMTVGFCLARQEQELQSPVRGFVKVENEDSTFMWMGGKTASVTAEYPDGKTENKVIEAGKEVVFAEKPVRLHVGAPGKKADFVLEKELKSGMEYDIKHSGGNWYLQEDEVAD